MKVKAYCWRCEAVRVMREVEERTGADGNRVVTGKCTRCNARVIEVGKVE